PQTQEIASPSPSCVSMKSDWSMDPSQNFSSGAVASNPRRHPFTAVALQTDTQLEKTGDLQQDFYKPVDDVLHRVLERHKTRMKNKYNSLFEGIKSQENKTLLNTIYVQLYIIEGETEGVNEEHEVLQMEKKPKKHMQDTSINCNNIFELSLEQGFNEDRKYQEEKLRTVLTKGIAGIGKTVSVQKFIVDWSEGKANQDVVFMFVLSFRELNLIKDRQYSFHRLLCDFHPEVKDLDPKTYDLYKSVFIFDGLDESRIPLNFTQCEKVSDVTMTSSVGVLMTNLFKGELLPSAHIWITSRPAAANQIPSKYINRVTEIQGFNDPQKEEYFRKRISDQDQANSIISHIKTARSLHIMCHIPVFCWISATVLKNFMKQYIDVEIPKTLTEMYIHFLLIQTNIKIQKYKESEERDPKKLSQYNREMILKLAELAFKQLMKGNVMFYEEDLRECGIDVTEASVYSGICTEIFKEETVLYWRKVYCFVHLSFQEFLAAFYVFHCYVCQNAETLLLFKPQNKEWSEMVMLEELLEGAVNKALMSQKGHLDLFLRFLLGISLESNQKLLQGILTHMQSTSESINKIIKMMMDKMKQRKCLPTERSINLFLCLTEMNDQSLSREIHQYLNSEKHAEKTLTPGQCSALACMLMVSDDVLDELDLKKYNTSVEGYRRLIPAVSKCSKALLARCNLTTNVCETVTLALQSPNSTLKELDLSYNSLQDSGVTLLSAGLRSSHCKLEILRLAGCNLTTNACETLSHTLKSGTSLLKMLDLSNNDLQDSGVKLLCDWLISPHCKLENFRLTACSFTMISCRPLCFVLKSANSLLKILDLSNNDLQDSGIELLSEGLNSSHCKLETLRLIGCNLTMSSCENFCFALQSANSHLRELDLSNNNFNNSGVDLLCSGLKSLHCKLEILSLASCNLTVNSCKVLASALQSLNSSLKELDLSNNDLQDLGVELLSVELKSSHCKLEILRLSGCMITEEGCCSLASALTSNLSHLKELDLTYNHPGESGLKLLSARLEDPHCSLNTLRVQHAGRFRIKPGIKKYSYELTLDPNTAHTSLSLCEGNRKVVHVREQQSYPHHPERFDYYEQVLCRESVTGRCYWEAEWSGREAEIAITYKTISRKGDGYDCVFGLNEKSWSLLCSNDRYIVWHNNNRTDIYAPLPSSKRIGVYVDCPDGILSFYSVSFDTHTLTHLYTLYSTFNEPLYVGFRVWGADTSMCICKIE
ncbi:NACHT, LRR and PYD domains-containing protein 3-like, partial [Colossoma macropomum]|uniref:NACHT, LRR and PYD domains-containing protein 3-like n=1 Tax=Colossoma macropomum TaxID=42526 RepID=UPI0018654355